MILCKKNPANKELPMRLGFGVHNGIIHTGNHIGGGTEFTTFALPMEGRKNEE